MVHGQKPTTSSGNLKAPAIETYLEWIYKAWDSLSKDLIVKSFVACGMTNDTDGKLDDQIHVFKVNVFLLFDFIGFKNYSLREQFLMDSLCYNTAVTKLPLKN